jgi:Subtilisin-like serine proteases
MMARGTRWGGGLVAAALVVSVAGVAGPAPAGAAPGSPGGAAGVAGAAGAPRRVAEAHRSVTLITGDRVTVGADGRTYSVQPGPGRGGIPMWAERRDGHLHVVPADAVPLVRSGRVDARLFDVTTLLGFGYDDRRADLPLILTGAAGAARGGTPVGTSGVEVVRQLPAVAGTAVRVARPRLGDLWKDITGGAGGAGLRGGPTTVWLDGLRKPTLEHSVPQIGAPAAWQAGYDGTGVTVAVLDTGIDDDHPDLAGQVVGRANFTEGEEDERDLSGHGTHVASTIAGTGAASGGRSRGVAPGAKLLDGKVCVRFGCAESWILAGMQWAAEQGAAVVNMSLGGWDTPEVDPLEAAVETLTERYGTLFVIAAGNEGEDGTISSPASADAALAVGAVDRDDDLARFSSRGPRTGDGGLKPDLTAPGVEILAARSGDAFPDEPDPYVAASGTSMAAPHVAGAAAILAQHRPRWRGPELKAALMASAVPHPELSVYAQGAGRVDVARAVAQTVVADPPSVGFGRQLWPHHDDVPVTRTVSYTNSGPDPVTLDLAVTATGPAGAPAPAGMFTVSPATVTVPAGGTAELSVTVDTRVDGPDGYYTGRLVGSVGGEPVVGTPLAVEREAESYDVTVTHLNRAGVPTDAYTTLLYADDDLTPYRIPDDGTTATLRLPRGRYVLLSVVGEDLPENPDPARPEHRASLLAQPAIDVTAPTALTVDARRAGPVSVTVPDPEAEMYFAEVSVELARPNHYSLFSLLGWAGNTLHVGQLGDDRPTDGLTSRVAGVWAKLDEEASAVGTPYLYHLAWVRAGRVLTGLTRDVRRADLATVRARYGRQVDGTSAWTRTLGIVPGVSESGWLALIPFTLPYERTEYLNTDGGIRWDREFEEWLPGAHGGDEQTVAIQDVRGLVYRRGTVTRERWNQGVFGPTLASPTEPEEWISRTGDRLFVVSPVHGDGAGHPGWSLTESVSLALYRDGEKIGEADELGAVFDVPAGDAEYRIEATATRGAPFTLSTRVEAVWSFRSRHVSGDDPVRLPLSTVRFSPPLDGRNAAPVGRLFAVPVSVSGQPGSAAARIRSLVVEVSYDDGRTWERARVVAVGGTGVVLLRHPEEAGYVSLRATATDRAGNSVRQTVIRAYALR